MPWRSAFDTDRFGELAYAESVAAVLRPGMVPAGVRNPATYRFFATITGVWTDF